MRLHIVPDEKIINRCIANFETVYPNENRYIVLTRTPDEHKYVKERDGVFFCRIGTKDLWEKVGDVNNYSSVIVHFLVGDSISFINEINHSNIYWIEWGADLYRSLLQPKGYQLYADKDILWKIEEQRGNKLLFKLRTFFSDKKKQRRTLNAAKKAKYFVPDSMYNEYPLLLKYYPELSHLQYRDFFYYPIDEILGQDLIGAYTKGSNIIVGNSASISNNHLYALDIIHSTGVSGVNIVVPLSYGAKGNYVKMVENKGHELFGDNFKAVKDYMPLNQYNELLLSARTFIYGSWRQEAVGNILIALYIGGKVFLDTRNPLLDFYKSLGLHIFGLDELTENEINSSLPEDYVEENRSILREKYSRERLLKLIKENF